MHIKECCFLKNYIYAKQSIEDIYQNKHINGLWDYGLC